jgi:ABC-2 type transport system ATP-binding protein
MSEMALTADHFIIIGRGRLITEGSKEELAKSGTGSVHVRTPLHQEFKQLVAEKQWQMREEADAFVIEGVAVAEVGDQTFAAGIPLHELSAREVSLEDSFMALTAGAVEYTGRRMRKGKL